MSDWNELSGATPEEYGLTRQEARPVPKSWQDLMDEVSMPGGTPCCKPRAPRPPATPEQIATLPQFMRGAHRLHRLDDCSDTESYHGDPEGDAPIEDADLISSRVLFDDPKLDDPFGNGLHRPVIDLDVRAALVPSTTEGHHHLYIDQLVPWDDYLDLLDAMVRCGLVEQGYYDAADRRGYTSVRLPWVTKEMV